MAWSSAIAELIKGINIWATSATKSASEKLKDIRLKNLKEWWKFKEKALEDQKKRDNEIDVLSTDD